MDYEIYTDGSCLGNPGPGGWAFVLYKNNSEFYFDQGAVPDTTNNRMELLAVIMACEYSSLAGLYKTEAKATIYTDSQYVKKGIEEWMSSWKKNNWRGAKGDIKNRDLWERLDALNNHLKPQWRWVKGHSGDEKNERANFLATEISETIRQTATKKAITDRKIYLSVPFSEKEEAKKEGAKWDPNEKKWYVQKETTQVQRWLKK